MGRFWGTAVVGIVPRRSVGLRVEREEGWGNAGKDFGKFSFLDDLKEMFLTPWDSGQGFSFIA
jgi:hypothetical protein